MATIPLPALDVKAPPPQENPLEEYARIANLKGALLAQQGQQIQNESMLRQEQDDQKWRSVMASPDWNGDPQQLLRMGIKAGVGPASYTKMQQAFLSAQKMHADMDETTLKNVQTANDQYRGRLLSIINAPDAQKQDLWDKEISAEEQAGKLQPGAMTHQYPGDDAAQTFANHFALGSVLAKEAIEDKAAEARQTSANAATGELALNQQKFAGSPEELARRAAQGDTEAQQILQQQNQQAVDLAGKKAGAEAAAKFPYELKLKQQELAQNPVFAVNPKTGQRELTTVEDAKTQGFTNPIKASQGDVEKETTLNAQMNDLQLNTSRYKAALNAMGPLSKSDVANMTRVLSDKSINSFLANELTLGVAIDQVSQGEKASAWNALSPDKQAALIGSLRMKNSALLFQKVSTGMGRASKEAMDIEIANMPSPIEGATVGNQKLQSFQENIDQMAARSVKLPWMDQPQDVKARIEGQATNDYNQRQAAKPQGKYRAGSPVTVGQNIQIRNVPGLSKVKKVYPDGTFDADQN